MLAGTNESNAEEPALDRRKVSIALCHHTSWTGLIRFKLLSREHGVGQHRIRSGQSWIHQVRLIRGSFELGCRCHALNQAYRLHVQYTAQKRRGVQMR